MALIIKTDGCWSVCYFSLIRGVGNIKGIFVLQRNYTRKGHTIYIRFVDKVKVCLNFDNSWCKLDTIFLIWVRTKTDTYSSCNIC